MTLKSYALIHSRAFLSAVTLLACLTVCNAARAEEQPSGSWKASSWTQTSPYFNQAGHKLGFGILNFGTGWMALFQEPFRPGGFFKGLARGIVYSVVYEGGGALHAVTFPIPIDFPLPRGGLSFED